jgi:outer membrane biosynthesis protein TonB
MKISKMLFAAILVLLMNSAVLSFGQQQDKKDDAQQEAKPADVKPEESKPDHRAQENKQENKQDQEMQNKQENKQENENKDQENRAREENKQQENQQQNNETRRAEQGKDKDKTGQGDHNRAMATGQERGSARASQHIPDDKFRQHFGREHHFKPARPVIVENRPRIQYGGYAFEIVDAWPVGWSYDDDCYIDYIDGEYFLFDLLHPGVRIALVVVL